MENKRLTIRWQDCGSLAIGLWLLVSPWLVDTPDATALIWPDSTYLAIAIIAVAIFTLCLPNIWSECLIFGIGIWMIASPLISKLDVNAPGQSLHQVMMIDSVLTSVFLLVFSLWVIFEDERLQKMFGKK